MKAGAMGAPGGQPIASGEPAPDFEIKTLDGATLKLSELRGKVVLIEFWATWCGPCLQQMPHLKETFREFGSHDDFVMIGISLDHDKRAWKAYVQKEGLSWHQALDRPEARDSVASLYKVMAIPVSWMIDKEGRVVASGVGAVLSSEEIARLLE
jgi:peroxiredoxin